MLCLALPGSCLAKFASFFSRSLYAILPQPQSQQSQQRVTGNENVQVVGGDILVSGRHVGPYRGFPTFLGRQFSLV